ncbi:hypothetical protein OPV22_010199 [Ensete ventricosum]|uniref:Uncharacterized protein n=1 Tax=Ensete ventricosum TaxID=4639 RepID=A0AAV8RGB1_ENSVE|nr:hypothetical protein OPV22_010199 [Ensete ventricosum]
MNAGMSGPKGIVTLTQEFMPQVVHSRNINSIPLGVEESLLESKSSRLVLFDELHQGYCLRITVHFIPDPGKKVRVQLTCLASTFQLYIYHSPVPLSSSMHRPRHSSF